MTKAITCFTMMVAFVAIGFAQTGELASIGTVLEKQVGGKWHIETNSVTIYLTLKERPPELERGTYCIFVNVNGKKAFDLVTMWIQICQAPFFILGTNTECLVVTYVPRKHSVSQSIIKALRLNEPKDVSPAEAMSVRKPEKEKK